MCIRDRYQRRVREQTKLVMFRPIALLLLGLTSATAQSVKSCGAAGDILSNAVFTVSPDPISKDQPLTITATGTLTAAVAGGNFDVDLNIKALGIINEPVKLTSPFTASPGFAAGPVKVTLGPFTLPKIPGTSTIAGTIKQTDPSGKPIMCVSLNLDVLHPPKETVFPEAAPVVSSCGKDTDHLKNLTMSSSGGVSTLQGVLDETVTTGAINVDMKVKVSFISIPIQTNIPFSFSPGIPAGPVKATVGPSSSSAASNINIDVEGTVTVNDGNTQEIACLSVTTPSTTLMTTFAPELFADASPHYEDPKPNGCLSDELAIQIQGVSGDFCTPKCTGFLKSQCPSDVPSGVTAKPQCALKDQSGNKYCALICTPGETNDSCGKATCKSISGVGICTYDD
eukprot:TRINITY_DN9602_c0_g1_i1.p2 TRINITY_DN9602_c0_g1~~TRINITY_DN9602_c0_g1_i1.p2  ORF type:complete len:397 (-),score=144.03 TRINITY_DN9602_c0_g1_i1:264-1454(-)